jgi:hypothetical protein
MIAGFVLAASIEFGLLSGYSYIPDGDALTTRKRIELPPQYVNLYVEGSKLFGETEPVEIIPFGGINNSFFLVDYQNAIPFDITWFVGVKLRYKNLEAGYTRECHHPTAAYIIEQPHQAQRLSAMSGEGISHNLYVKLEIGGRK